MHCPICNHSATTVILESQDYSLTQESFSVYQCMDCNFRFTGSIPSQDTIGRYYKFIEYIFNDEYKNIIKIYTRCRKPFILPPHKGPMLICCSLANESFWQ
jgi:C4-type Zn-finger protein